MIGGNSKQETRSGKNKLNLPILNYTNRGLTWDITESKINISGTATTTYTQTNYIDLKQPLEPGSYKLAIENDNNNLIYGIWLFNKDEEIIATVKNTSPEITLAEEVIKYGLFVEKTVVDTSYNVTFKPMILESTEEDESFEQYGAMPSPEYPSEIRNVGDNVNEFDISKITNTSKITNDGKTLTIANNSNSVGAADTEKTLKQLCPNLKVGDVVTLNFKTTTQNAEYKNSIFIGRYWSVGNTITLTETDLNTSVVLYGGYQETSVISEIKIEKGKQATAYSPHGCGNANATDCNKNLVGGQWTTGLYNVNGDLGNTNGVYKCFKKFLKAGTYVYSYNADITIARYVNLTSKTNLSLNAGNKNFTLGEDAEISLGFRKTDSSTWNLGENLADIEFQLEPGNTATNYVEHQEQNFLFPLAEGQRFMLGDYLAKDGIHHVRKQVVLDGTENWMVSGNSYYLTVAGKKLRYELTKGKMLCTHFKETTTGVTREVEVGEFFEGYYSTGNRNVFFNYDNGEGGVEGFKSYLSQQKQAGTPVILEYELEEEEIEPYTEEQKKAYNKILQTAKSYKNVTNIFSPDPVSPIFNVDYRKDIDAYIDNKLANVNTQILNIAGGN